MIDMLWLLFILVSYLVGSINPTYIIGHLYGFDVRLVGRRAWGSCGAMKAWHFFGWSVGIFVFLFDALKIFFAAWFASIFISSPWILLFCILAGALGHIFPFYLQFSGGYGIASAWGGVLFFIWHFFGSWYDALFFSALVMTLIVCFEMFVLFPLRGHTKPKKIILMRKILRFVALLIPALFAFLPRTIFFSLLGIVTIIFFVFDVLHLHPRSLYKRSEKRGLSGISLLLLSCLVLLFLLPAPLAILTVIYVLICDNVAALCGSRFFVKPLLWNKYKSREGTRCALFATFWIGYFLAPLLALPLWIVSVSALLAALFESLPLPVDDNISLPLLLGISVWLLSLLL